MSTKRCHGIGFADHRDSVYDSQAKINRRTLEPVPTLEIVSLQDAKRDLSLTGKRGAIVRQYMGYIDQLEAGQVGKLTPDEGETTAALRRRLGAAADLLGKKLVVNRQGNTVFFWEEGEGPTPRRRGRRRRSDTD